MEASLPAHSPIGASSYKRWKNCPGSVNLAKRFKSWSSVFAEEGTEAHDLAYRILIARRKKMPTPDLIGYDDDMLEHVLFYVDHMLSMKRKGAIQLYEHKFHLKAIHPLCFGTADGVTYYPDKKLLVISDFKYGAGRFVDANKNDQLLYYATGAVLSLGFPAETIRIEIIQPRLTYAESIRPWECTRADIDAFAKQLRIDAKATEDPNAPLCAGEWCVDCTAAPGCPLLRLKAKVLMSYADREVTPEELAADLEWIDTLKAVFQRKHEYAYNMAMRGETIPGWKLVEKRGHRKWKVDPDELADDLVLSGFTADQVLTPPVARVLKSPAQIEALPVGKNTNTAFKTKKDLKEFVKQYTVTSSSGFKLAPEHDAGEAVKPVMAKSVFSAIPKNEIAELS